MEKYTFRDFKNDIINAGFETMFKYNGKTYSVSIEPKPEKINKRKPLWVFMNESDGIEHLRSTKEQICDEIMIDGKNLKDLWSEITIV